MEELLLLNNQGVHLLQQKDTEGAISRFTRAMYLASQFLPHDFGNPTGYPARNDHDDDDDFPIVTCVPLGETPITLEALQVSDSGGNANHATHFDMYDRAFVFYTPETTMFDCIPSQTVVDAVLLFNLGLAYHRLAVTATTTTTTTASTKDESLKNALAALRCYKCGINLIRHADKPSGEPLFLLALATLNNLAHTFWYCDRPKEAHHCQDMLDTLMESYIPDYLSREDADFFYFGKFYRTHGLAITVAAAA